MREQRRRIVVVEDDPAIKDAGSIRLKHGSESDITFFDAHADASKHVRTHGNETDVAIAKTPTRNPKSAYQLIRECKDAGIPGIGLAHASDLIPEAKRVGATETLLKTEAFSNLLEAVNKHARNG